MKHWNLVQITPEWWMAIYGEDGGDAELKIALPSESAARQFLRLQLVGTHATTLTTAEMLAAGGYYEGQAA